MITIRRLLTGVFETRRIFRNPPPPSPYLREISSSHARLNFNFFSCVNRGLNIVLFVRKLRPGIFLQNRYFPSRFSDIELSI